VIGACRDTTAFRRLPVAPARLPGSDASAANHAVFCFLNAVFFSRRRQKPAVGFVGAGTKIEASKTGSSEADGFAANQASPEKSGVKPPQSKADIYTPRAGW
jgi:hypothetical protein